MSPGNTWRASDWARRPARQYSNSWRKPYLNSPFAQASRRDYSEATSREIDLAIRKLIEDAFVRAKSLLVERRADLDAGSRLLLERETITPAEFPPIGGSRPSVASA